MPVRLRKLIGAVLLVVLVTVYPFLALAFAAALLPGTGPIAQFAFYLVAGLVWVLPAGLIIWWMADRTAPAGSR